MFERALCFWATRPGNRMLGNGGMMISQSLVRPSGSGISVIIIILLIVVAI